MAAPHPRLRKALSAPGLLKTIRESFASVPDSRGSRVEIALCDALMAGLAVFGLKYPSLLKFDEAAREDVIRHNLRTLYGVERAPCDTQMRTILDPVAPEHLRPAFRAVHRELQRHKALEAYRYLDGYYLVSVDGTGQFASSAISCPHCCVKKSQGQESYYHQLLGAVLVHPALKTVLPLAAEPITRQDGASKNDCERNAAKRLLQQLRQDYPNLKILVVEDSLSANGPHLELLKELNLRFLIGVKPGDHEALYEAVQVRLRAGQCQEIEVINERGVACGYRFVNDLALNKAHPKLRVNYLEYWEVEGDEERIWSWITDLWLTRDNVEPLMRGGRARWKIESAPQAHGKEVQDELTDCAKAAREMKVGPSESASRSRLQTTPSRCGQEPSVVSIGVKASGAYPEQVWVREANASEPSWTRRKPKTCRRNQGRFYLLGPSSPETWCAGRAATGV